MQEIYPANQSISEIPAEVEVLGEGGEEGILKPGRSPAFAVLEVSMYCLSEKSCPILYSNLLYKIGQDFSI